MSDVSGVPAGALELHGLEGPEGTATAQPRRPAAWLLVLWIAAASLSSLCGIGGGLFAVPMLHFLGGLPLRRAVGTALVLVCLLASVATATEALRTDSALDLKVAALLIFGSLLGAQLGYRVARRIRTRWLELTFVVVLSFVGLRILLLPSAAVLGGGAVDWTPATVALVAGIGLCGGFLAPLLGIGGGLVVVPALFFLLPEFGYLEARANSMAMGAVVSAWSARLHFKGGDVNVRGAAWFAGSTVVGAVLGVLSVHQEGWAGVARVALGVVLLVVAVRFARDVVRRRGS